jgi:cytochrome bd-type quinol oxidase subunit 2
MGGKVYVQGGSIAVGEQDAESRLWIFDPATEEWSEGPALPARGRFLQQMATIGSTIYVLGGIGLLLYVYAVVLSVLTLKTERKAQKRAYEILEKDYHITSDELAALKELFHLYNIQYVNDIILAALELLYLALEITDGVKNGNLKV